MLKNLLKHELKYMFKFLSIFYCLALVFALLTRLFFNIENSLVFNIIGQVCSGATISMIFSIVINNTMRFWVRFRQTLYGDESYLTHTLPIKTSTIYTSKMLTGLITMFVSVLVIALTLFVAYYSKENIQILKNAMFSIEAVLNVSMGAIIAALMIILFLQYSCIMQCGFTGIILGHKMQSGKIGFSVLFGFIVYSVTQTVALISVFVSALFNKDLMNMFFTNELSSISILKFVFILIGAAYLVFVILGFILNTKLLKKGVDVD